MSTTNPPSGDHPPLSSPVTQQRRALIAGLGGIAAGAFVASRSAAGPIDPPPGPVASTGKTLTEVEPRRAVNATNTPGDAGSLFVISQPGSYYLTGNVTGVAGKRGIKILANYVTLDLMGFSLSGVAGSLSGITTDGNLHRAIEIRNGAVNSWGADGVSLSGFGFSLFELRLFNNGNHGLTAALDTRLQACTAFGNGNIGFDCGNGATVRECLASGNSWDGFRCGENASFTGCIAKANQGVGIRCANKAVVDACHAMDNQDAGILLGNASSAANCAVSNNAYFGIGLGDSGSVSNCAARACFYGISVGNGGAITGSTATECVERAISTVTGCVVEACAVQGNFGYGIYAGTNCTIRGNNCSNNTNAPGIAASVGNRIEGNNCLNNLIGIWVTATVNLVFGNSCRGNNTNFSIVANNRVGNIVVPPLSGAINGNSGAAGLGSTDPWANFAF